MSIGQTNDQMDTIIITRKVEMVNTVGSLIRDWESRRIKKLNLTEMDKRAVLSSLSRLGHREENTATCHGCPSQPLKSIQQLTVQCSLSMFCIKEIKTKS